MKYVALSLVAVLAMASVSMGAIIITGNLPTDAVDLGDPNDVLVAYTIKVQGANAFKGITIEGAVHQMGWGTTPSPWVDSFDAMLDASGAAKAYDTHIMLAEANRLVINAGTIAETNDGTNPGAIPLPINFVNTAGMGAFNVGTAEFTALGVDIEAGFNLMQIVLPKGEMVVLSGIGSAGTGFMEFSTAVGIPEPGTIMLLLTGVLCLLGLRRR